MVARTLVSAVPRLVSALGFSRKCPSRRGSTLQAKSPMSLTFGGADAPSARGSQPRSSDLAELSTSRAGRPAQAKGPPHKQMPESGKTKWHWAKSPRHKFRRCQGIRSMVMKRALILLGILAAGGLAYLQCADRHQWGLATSHFKQRRNLSKDIFQAKPAGECANRQR